MLQGILMAVNKDGNGPAEDQDKTGPTDDGQIITAVAGLPADPYCCQGPEPVEGGVHCLHLAVAAPASGYHVLIEPVPAPGSGLLALHSTAFSVTVLGSHPICVMCGRRLPA